MKYLFIILATFATASAAALPQPQNEVHHIRGKRSPEYPPVTAEESMDEINPVKLIKAGNNLINILEQFLSSKANATPVFTFDLGDFITNNPDLFPDIAKILKSAGKEFGIDDPDDLLNVGSNILSIIDLVLNGKNSTMPIISVALAKFIKKNPNLFPILTKFLKSSEKEFGVIDPVELIKDGSKVIYTIDHVLNQGGSTLPFFDFSLADYIKNNLDLSPALRTNLSTAASDLRDFINNLVDVLLKGKDDEWDIFAHYSEIFKKLKQEGLTLTWV